MAGNYYAEKRLVKDLIFVGLLSLPFVAAALVKWWVFVLKGELQNGKEKRKAS